MKLKTIVLTVMLSLGLSAFSQSQQSVEEHGIKKVQIFETDFENGERDKRIIEERVYDSAGNMIEFKEFGDDGKPEKWEKYTYNAQGKMTSESTFSAKGDLKKRIEHIYVKGLKTEKRYYDSKERLTKTKYYEYAYH